ncbi:putative nucleotide-binding alpha-beta plait domain superfamily, RNA-binding domain superfamily [Helianthus anomalus]
MDVDRCLANAFRCFGDIAGAFIAKKKDKEGRKFGFVSFKGVIDAVGLEASMANMKLGGNKLSVNVARFAKENVGSVNKLVGGSNRTEGHNNLKVQMADPLHRKPAAGGSKGRSFVDILLNKSSPSRRWRMLLRWIFRYLLSPTRQVFNVIAKRYGRVVHESMIDEKDGDLTFDCLGVLTDNGNLISGVLKLNWQDKIYRVWIK